MCIVGARPHSSSATTDRVRTDGPEGKLADFEIAHTWRHPLQQHRIVGGRLQALGVAWARPGLGQRWFHLYPNAGCVPGIRWLDRLDQN
jgi:hypothetical protein